MNIQLYCSITLYTYNNITSQNTMYCGGEPEQTRREQMHAQRKYITHKINARVMNLQA